MESGESLGEFLSPSREHRIFMAHGDAATVSFFNCDEAIAWEF